MIKRREAALQKRYRGKSQYRKSNKLILVHIILYGLFVCSATVGTLPAGVCLL